MNKKCGVTSCKIFLINDLRAQQLPLNNTDQIDLSRKSNKRLIKLNLKKFFHKVNKRLPDISRNVKLINGFN